MKLQAAFFLGISLLMSSLFAQPYLQPKPGKSADLVQLQQQFDEWSNQVNLDEEKGWKWSQRYLEHWNTRTQPNGQPPLPGTLQQGLSEYAEAQAASRDQSRRTANWMPFGPEVLPPGAQPGSQHGMGRINCIAFHPTDSNTFWVGVAQGGVWKTTNHGQSWLPLTDELPILRISDIAVNPNNPDEIYLSVGDYAYMGIALDLDGRKRHTHYGLGVYKTTDGGLTWQPTGLTTNQEDLDASLTRRVFIGANDDQELVAAGIYGIRKSYDGGANWSPVLDSLIWDIEQSPHNPAVLFATGGFVNNLQTGTSTIYKSTNFGESWTELATGIPAQNQAQRIEVAVSPVDSNYVYALACDLSGGFFGLYRSTDGGQNWQARSTKQAGDPNILYWYVGGGGGGGQGTYDLILLPDPNDKEVIYAGGVNIWKSNNGGSDWEMVTLWYSQYGLSLHADQHFLTHNPLDDQFYICNDGGVMRTREMISARPDSIDNTPGFQWETQWEDLSSGMQITSFYRLGLCLSDPSAVIAGAQDNSTFIKIGNNWTNSFGGDGMEGFFQPNDPNHLYGSSQFGRLLRSYDGGVFYDRISDGLFDRGAWTTPFMLEPGNPNVLYAAMGQMYRSTNDGVSWTQLSNFPATPGYPNGYTVPASDMAIAPSNANYIYLTKRIYYQYNEPSRIWRTTNGGLTWDDVTAGLPDSLYFSYVSVSPNDPELIWVTVSGFGAGEKVYRSEDGGDSWENISYNLPNLPANCVIPQDSSLTNLIYVAMDRGIYYLNDSLTEWELYAEGMPNVIVSELEIHPTEKKLYASTFGRGIWVSDLVVEQEQDTMFVSREDVLIDGMEMTLFPNPNSGSFQLELDKLPPQALAVEIRDIMGRQLWAADIPATRTSWQQQIDLSLSYGLYFVRVKGPKYSRTLRFVVE